ncbi:glutamine-dependent NAD synthetase [Chondrus crispus]|uniref:Glutamine-dependent NAD(+) synthetase n=1 Tax=Chondrus crispus TaxID=2769 RepID=R7Q879_CHOCR|nr:glutamine-dependent NAD synthetase [Chondrus crispus]CDF33983.1 glutamine-dependent NAD synthetase [Chondrus crispus]|eukprot:XP_005713802.1 glutamine-dependent NAD synthetase [Chondrus crispus]
MHLATVATCNLNQWALDFTGNLRRTRASIAAAVSLGARYRVGPELETTGYGAEDHFLELDTEAHSWQAVAELMSAGDTEGVLLDVGAPVLHRGVLYNCRLLLLDRRVLLVRPKMDLADHANYREARWFRAWPRERQVEQFLLPECVRERCADFQMFAPIGNAVLRFEDGLMLGCETCEELWTPRAPHLDMQLDGVHVIGNGSASHHVLRKLHVRERLLESATRKGGGVYVYANQIGCDGGRLYYDGSALIALNGDIIKQAPQFTVESEVQVIAATVDIDHVRSYRMSLAARAEQAARNTNRPKLHVIQVEGPFSICLAHEEAASAYPTPPLERVVHCSPWEEIARGPACWLWDYLRRSGLNGFFLPLSGGADSSSTAAIVGSMCQMLVNAAAGTDPQHALLQDIRNVTGAGDDYIPTDARELARRILHTVYMGSKEASSAETKRRAAVVAEQIGAWHADVNIDGIVLAILAVFQRVFGEGKCPQFRAHGGTKTENMALQCVQARIRMVVAYLFAQLTLWARGRSGSLLVLGSANVDEALRGYLTKYDCSSADINPIGGISKADLRAFLRWAADEKEGLGYSSLVDVVEAAPTAELEPITKEYTQTDEEDMGMTYDELSWFGKLRKLHRCGPFAMYERLRCSWRAGGLSAREVADKVKFFFRMYAINRHKLTVLTPSYHAEDYSPDDNRFDLRQFLYNARWSWQFERMDEDVARRRPKDQ